MAATLLAGFEKVPGTAAWFITVPVIKGTILVVNANIVDAGTANAANSLTCAAPGVTFVKELTANDSGTFQAQGAMFVTGIQTTGDLKITLDCGSVSIQSSETFVRSLPLHPRARVVTDLVTTITDATVTSATAEFKAADVGRPIRAAGIPAGTTIASINSATSIEMSGNASASATVTGSIGIPVKATASSVSLATSGAASITLSAAVASTDDVLASCGFDGDTSGTVGVTHGTGWTEDSDVGSTANIGYGQAQQRSGSTSTSVGWDDVSPGTMPVFSGCGMAMSFAEGAALAPDPPTVFFAGGGHQRSGIEWIAPFDNGSAITDYDIDWATAAAPTTWLGPITIGSTNPYGAVTGLTNGTAYVFRVRAVNAIGNGEWSATSGSATPSDVRGKFLLEDGTSKFLLEDGTSKFLLESGDGDSITRFWGVRIRST